MNNKQRSYSLSLVMLISLFSLIALVLPMHLQGGGMGKTDEKIEYESTVWNGIYFNMNGLYFTAYIPNSEGTTWSNGGISFRGKADKNSNYVVSTSQNANYSAPNKLQEFLKAVQDANPHSQAVAVDPKGLGAKYVVDLIPNDPSEAAYWRFLCTKDRLIKMGTDDENGNRRTYFFESIYIR